MNWFDPISVIKGVGPKTHELFGKLGVFTVKDLMFHFPFRFDDVSVRELETIIDQESVTLQGTVVTPPVAHYYGGKRNRLMFQLQVSETQVIQVVFFNQAYLKKQIQLGETVAVYGRYQTNGPQLLGMRLIKSGDDELSAVYPATKGLSVRTIVNTMKEAFNVYGETIEDPIPTPFNEKYGLVDLKTALYQMHFPKNKEARQQAAWKIIYTEFFDYQLQLGLAAQKNHQQTGIQVFYEVDELREVIQALPFELTADQKQVINEICFDLRQRYPMRRLLQGDVGSGKTLVAFITMIAAVLAGYQTALMVPTEILAKQHVESFNQFFEKIGLRAELLISEMPTQAKEQVIDGLSTGRIRLVIGTHALIQPPITFKNLGYIVIDEQHRFGVGQREALFEKGNQPNVLQMTATPIPRSMALSIYGDLDVSTISQRPAGRRPIETTWIQEGQIEQVYQAIDQALLRGEQIYYVLPMIEESEHFNEVENVNAALDRLEDRFKTAQIGALHGQLDRSEQTNQMDMFKNKAIDILVATTMIEVGVDVPNATIMVIQSAERFGLAQLHQLRGRVGRSNLQSYTYLIANPSTEHGVERMQAMTETEDGFKISEKDMKLRGIGDVLGRSQSGLPQFNYANLIEDQVILEAAQRDVNYLIHSPEQFDQKELKQLQTWIQQQKIEL